MDGRIDGHVVDRHEVWPPREAGHLPDRKNMTMDPNPKGKVVRSQDGERGGGNVGNSE